MHHLKKMLLLINILGGLAVLGSYVWGFLTYPNAVEILWGGVPPGLRPFYTISMFLAAGGYFAFSSYILRMDPLETKVFGQSSFEVLNAIYALILIPSALWMPLTVFATQHSSLAGLWLVRLDLVVVAVASLVLLFALFNIQPRQTVWMHRLAVLGCMAFCIQTVILDAIIWLVYFHLY